MPPAIIAGGVAAAGAIGGAAIGASAQKKAAKKAAQAQTDATAQNIALARENRDILTGYIDPYNKVGLNANQALTGQIAAGPYGSALTSGVVGSALNPGSFDDYRASTGYDFRLGEGVKALGLNKWAAGTSQSGDTLRALTRYGQDFGSNEYQNYIGQLRNYLGYVDAWNNQERAYATDQHNQYVNLLTGQQNVGLNAVGALAGVGNNTTNSIMASNNQAAAALSNQALASGAANANMWSTVGGALGQLAGTIGQRSAFPAYELPNVINM